jgi:hypothetical protein
MDDAKLVVLLRIEYSFYYEIDWNIFHNIAYLLGYVLWD